MQKFTILQIDDNKDIKFLSEKAFRNSGFRYLFASTAQDGIKLAFEEKPDLLLVDFFLDEMTGIDLLHTLQENPEYREIAQIPAILLTGDSAQVLPLLAQDRLNVIAVLRKPFGMRELVNIVENVHWNNSSGPEKKTKNSSPVQNDEQCQQFLMLKSQLKNYADTIQIAAKEMLDEKKTDVMDEDYINYFTVYNCSRHIIKLLEQSSLFNLTELVDHGRG